MLTNPGAMKKAQNEIDLVIGRGHLPTFEDEPSMPYVTAVVKETLRWRDVAPIGRCSSSQRGLDLVEVNLLAVPHLVDVEDEYKGYRIPKNSIIIPNAWYETPSLRFTLSNLLFQGYAPRRRYLS